MSLGIPGDAVMALILGALIIKGIQPGPQLITEHPDIFWGLIASFWIGNVLLVILNVPMIGVWVQAAAGAVPLPVPVGAVLHRGGRLQHEQQPVRRGRGRWCSASSARSCWRSTSRVAPIVLGFVLGPMLEENFRRAMLLSRGDLLVFVENPISAAFIAASCLLLVGQLAFGLRAALRRSSQAGADPVVAPDGGELTHNE